MAYTLDDYNKLRATLTSGAKRTRYGDKETESRSTDELLRSLHIVEQDLIAQGLLPAPASAGVVRGGHTFAEYSGE